MKVLVVQQRMGIGDMVIFLPYIHAISKKLNSPVSLLVKKNSKAEQLCAEDPHIEEIICLPDAGFHHTHRSLLDCTMRISYPASLNYIHPAHGGNGHYPTNSPFLLYYQGGHSISFRFVFFYQSPFGNIYCISCVSSLFFRQYTRSSSSGSTSKTNKYDHRYRERTRYGVLNDLSS